MRGIMQKRVDRAEKDLLTMCQRCQGNRCGNGRACTVRDKARARLRNARRHLQVRQAHMEYARIVWQVAGQPE